ncbi:dienelactone hydrolase family protein [Rhodospirillaceae bacterium]|nr:dienelactone hydrolase family protein [Rhodospirillaceae bacterium]
MGEIINATASDGHEFDIYLAQSKGSPRGGIVLIQEIFGVNNHIKNVAEKFSSNGYLVGAPSLFDRVQPDIQLGYSTKDVIRGKQLKDNLGNEKPLIDIIATLNIVRSAGRVAVVGYCWGGTLAWLSACHVDGFDVAISYYGGGIGQLLSIEPRCPSIFHFGEQDHAISIAEINSLRQAHPECPIYLYPAGHGFNCEQRDSFHSTSSAIAFERTIQYLDKYI